jgi:hypothetical protein
MKLPIFFAGEQGSGVMFFGIWRKYCQFCNQNCDENIGFGVKSVKSWSSRDSIHPGPHHHFFHGHDVTHFWDDVHLSQPPFSWRSTPIPSSIKEATIQKDKFHIP